MGFPSSREETATPANPIKSATINAIQDAIVDLYNNGPGYGERVRHIAATAGRTTGGTFLAAGIAPFISNGNWAPSAADQTITIPFTVDEGETITKVEFGLVTNSTAIFDLGYGYTESTAFGFVYAGLGLGTSTLIASQPETVIVNPADHDVPAGVRGYYAWARVNGAIAADAISMQIGAISVYTMRTP